MKIRYNETRDDDIWRVAQGSTKDIYKRGKDSKAAVIDMQYIDSALATTYGEIGAADALATVETGITITSATGLDVGVVNLFWITGGEYSLDQGTLVGTGNVSMGTGIPIHAWMDATPASGDITVADGGNTYITITGTAVDSNGGQIPIPSNYRANIDGWKMTQLAMGTVATDEQIGWLDIRNYETGGQALTDDQYGIQNITNGYAPISDIKGEIVYKNSETVIPYTKYIATGLSTRHEVRLNVWKKNPNI